MRWKKFDWYNMLKQLFLLGIGYLVIQAGILVVHFYVAPGGMPLITFLEIAVFIIMGRIFQYVYTKPITQNQKKFIFILSIIIITLYGLIPQPFFKVNYYTLIKLATTYVSFLYGASVNKSLDHYDVMNRLKIYTLLLGSLSFFVNNAKLFEKILPILFVYMIWSLVTLSLYNMERVNSALPENYTASMKRKWVQVSALISIFLAAGAGVVFSAYNPVYIKNLFIMLEKFYDGFINVFIKVITPILTPVIYILGYMALLLRRFAKHQVNKPVGGNPSGDLLHTRIIYKGIPPALTSFFKGIALIVVIAAFAMVLMIILKKWRTIKAEDVEEIRESIFEWKNVKKNLMESIKRLGHMHRPKRGTIKFSDTPAFRVRKLYVDLMKQVKEKGCVREPSQTPLEFAPYIVNLYGEGCRTLVQTITKIYIRARYYPESVTKEDVLDAMKAFENWPLFKSRPNRDSRGETHR